MKFNYNFINDWCNILRYVLKNEYGFDDATISLISNEDLPFKVIYFEERRIVAKSRNLYESSNFHCPPDMVDGWEDLKEKIKNGDDLTPYLSKGAKNLDYQDKMLNEWGIYHFHLGTSMKDGFIERTGPLLFAFVTGQAVYAVNIYNHNDWAEDAILQTIHDNWPQLISGYKVSDIIRTSTTVTATQRISLRKVNANSFFTATDGTVYVPTGGGSVGSGYNLSTTLKVLKTKEYFDSIGKMLDSLPEGLKEQLISAGYLEGEDVDANLIILDTGYNVYFPKYNSILNIYSPTA